MDADERLRRCELVNEALRMFLDRYGMKADVVCVSRDTVGTDAYEVMNEVLAEHGIGLEVDDRITDGKFMFVNRELAATDRL